METLLQVNNLNVTYRNKHKDVYAVQNAGFTINKGDSLGIVGESGSGKSTLAMALLRLLPDSVAHVDGSAVFMGLDLITATEDQLDDLRWKHMSVVFQKAMNALSPVHRIRRQIEDIYRVHSPKATRTEISQRAAEMLKLVNLGERVYRLYPHELSGGMLQRVAIAISLLHKPSLLIMDEATTALDVVTQGQILNEIKRMEEVLHTTRIMITHDMSVVATTCNKIVVMYAGYIVESGSVRDVMKSPVHPYTKGLLASFPSLKGRQGKLQSIGGFLPDLSIKHTGCIFSPRCPQADDICKTHAPPTRTFASDRTIACHKAGGDAL